MTELTITTNPAEFFREQISKAVENQRLDLNPEIEFYLVNLMCDFIEPSRLLVSDTEKEINPLDTPVALLLKRALESPPEFQLPIYKAIGDTSLYLSGYFQDYFNDKAFSIEYFIGMGSNAYQNVSRLKKDQFRDRSKSTLFCSLADNFKHMVEVVAEVSENLDWGKPSNLLSIYERWINNQSSDRLRRKLEESGIAPIPINLKSLQ